MRFFALILALTIGTTAQAYTTTNTIYADNIAPSKPSLPYLPTTMTAWMNVKPAGSAEPGIRWDIGTFMPTELPTAWIELNEQNAAASGIDWALLEQYLLGDVTYTKCIDADVIEYTAEYNWPFQGYPSPRVGVNKLQFQLRYFITDVYYGKNRAAIAGAFAEDWELGNEGDYNGNGVRDAADYVAWRNYPAGHDGVEGYSIWRSKFDVPDAPWPSSGVGIPEPSTWTLCVVALLVLNRRQFRV